MFAYLQVDSSGEVVKLEKFCPWKEHLHHLEKKEAIGPVIKFVLYQESEGGKWRIQVQFVGASDSVYAYAKHV